MVSILIATPCLTGKVDVNYTTSLLQMCGKLGSRGVPHGFDMLVGKKVDMARNLQVQAMLEQDFTHIFFVDDDQAWSADLIFRLLALDVDIVSVPIRKRMDQQVYNLRHGEQVTRLLDRDDVIEVEFIGTGVMLIRRNVFESLKDHVSYCEQLGGKVLTPVFFHTQIIEKSPGVFQEQGEDVFFCRLAGKHGFKVYAYLDEDVAHMGDKAYVGNYGKLVGKDSNGVSFLTKDQKEPLRLLKQD